MRFSQVTRVLILQDHVWKTHKPHEMLGFSQSRGSFPFEFALRSWSQPFHGGNKKKVGGFQRIQVAKNVWFYNFHHDPPNCGHNLSQEELFFGEESHLWKLYECYLESRNVFKWSFFLGNYFWGERALWKTIGDLNGANWEPLEPIFVEHGPLATGSSK